MEHKLEQQLQHIHDYIAKTVIMQKEFLTLGEAAVYAGISKSYLYKLTSQRLISFYRPASKLIYFKRIELDAWILNNRNATHDELANETINLLKHNRNEKEKRINL